LGKKCIRFGANLAYFFAGTARSIGAILDEFNKQD
jgi:hypothetical protein